MDICSIPNCEKDADGSRGWCAMHYTRWRRHGDPNYVDIPDHPEICTVDRCERDSLAKGLCTAHYQRKAKYGDVMADKPIGYRNHAQCTIADCGKDHHAKGYCQSHYHKHLRYGDPEAPHGNRQHEICTLPECDESHQAKGLCSKHYTRYQRHGDPNYVKEEHNPKAPDYCELDGCEKEHAAKGFCRDHYARHYRDKYKSYYRSLRRLRHSRRREAQPSWANAHRIESFYDKARWLTNVTGVQHHVDHIDPLQHDKVCGLHAPANLQVVEADYNHKKKNSFDLGAGNTPLREQA